MAKNTPRNRSVRYPMPSPSRAQTSPEKGDHQDQRRLDEVVEHDGAVRADREESGRPEVHVAHEAAHDVPGGREQRKPGRAPGIQGERAPEAEFTYGHTGSGDTTSPIPGVGAHYDTCALLWAYFAIILIAPSLVASIEANDGQPRGYERSRDNCQPVHITVVTATHCRVFVRLPHPNASC